MVRKQHLTLTLQKNVTPVQVAVISQVQILKHAKHVEVMVELGLNRDFLQYSRHVLIVEEKVRSLVIPAKNVADLELEKKKKTLSIQIPKGVDDGTRIRLAGKGEAGSKGGADGDLYVYIQVKKHELFQREEENLYYELPISLADASLGTSK